MAKKSEVDQMRRFKELFIPYIGCEILWWGLIIFAPDMVELNCLLSFVLEKLYTPITTFLFFNLFATLGNVATEWIRKVGRSPCSK